MRNLNTAVVLLAMIVLAGCNDTPFVPEDFGSLPAEKLDGNPVVIPLDTVFVSAYDGGAEVTVLSYTRNAFTWGENLTVTSTADWITIDGPSEEVEPYGTFALTLKTYRRWLEPGIYHEYLTLWYNERFMEYIPVTVQVGMPDAIPVGTYNNYIRIPEDETQVLLPFTYNSDDIPEGRSGGEFIDIEASESWMDVGAWVGQSIPPVYIFFVEVDRWGLESGLYHGHLDIFWKDNFVQIINVEMEVEE